jgi:hypothetical protein
MYPLLIHEENWINCIIKYIPFDTFKMKIIIKIKIQMTQNDICLISNLFLYIFNILTWHHSNYRRITIPYNHEIINVTKIVLCSPFSVRPSFWVFWLWLCLVFLSTIISLFFYNIEVPCHHWPWYDM